MPHVYRVAIDSDSPGAIGVQVGLGGVPETTRARLTTGASASSAASTWPHIPTRVDDARAAIQMANNHHSHLVGAGWSQVHADLVGPYRETSGREAELIVPVSGPGPIRVGVQLLPLPLPGAAPASAPVGLRFNGLELPTIAALPLWRRYWWDVPAAAVRSGVNEVVLTVSDHGLPCPTSSSSAPTERRHAGDQFCDARTARTIRAATTSSAILIQLHGRVARDRAGHAVDDHLIRLSRRRCRSAARPARGCA